MNNSSTVYGVRSIHAEAWDAIGASSMDLDFATSDGPFTVRVHCRYRGQALAYAAAINSVSRPASPYDPELDGVAEPISTQQAA